MPTFLRIHPKQRNCLDEYKELPRCENSEKETASFEPILVDQPKITFLALQLEELKTLQLYTSLEVLLR